MRPRHGFFSALARSLGLSLLVLAQPLPASGQERGALSDFCEYVNAEADARQAALLAPEAYASLGLAAVPEDSGESDLVRGAAPRVTAGLRYRFANLFRSETLEARAAAECQKMRALAALGAVLANADSLGRVAGLRNKRTVLYPAIRDGEQVLERLELQLRSAEATAQEVDSVRARVESLRSDLARVDAELSRLSALPELPRRRIEDLLRDLVAAQRASDAADHELAAEGNWEVELRVGYDQIFGATERVPVAASLLGSLNLGALWQPSAHSRSERAHARYQETAESEMVAKVRRILRTAREVLRLEEARLGETRRLQAEVAARLDRVRPLEGEAARAYELAVRFEKVRLDGEEAFLEAEVTALRRFLGVGSP